jgi:hypothetical protein
MLGIIRRLKKIVGFIARAYAVIGFILRLLGKKRKK